MKLFKKLFFICFGFLLTTGLFLQIISFNSPKVHANTRNYVEQFDINITELSNDTIEIEYDISYQFNKPSRGTFLSLPKNQGGIWTDYKIQKVTQTKDSETIIPKYSQFLETNQFRFRVGDKDIFLSGLVDYEITLIATKNPDQKYDFVFLRDWLDQIKNINIRLNGTEICNNTTCKYESITINPTKQPVSSFQIFFFSHFEYIILFIVSLFSFLFIMLIIKKRRYNPYYRKEKPAFDVPNVYPWMAAAIELNYHSSLPTQDFLVSYLLFLNQYKYVDIIPNNKPETKGNKLLNNFIRNVIQGKENDKIKINIIRELPEKFTKYNKIVENLVEYGLQSGVYKSKLSSYFTVSDDMKQFYKFKTPDWSLFLSIACSILFIIILLVFRDSLAREQLIGYSLQNLYTFSFIIFAILINYLLLNLNTWTDAGLRLYAHIKGYKYYTEEAEKERLDFSNNPEVGVKRYLQQVPFAAALGILPKFNKYFDSLNIQLPQKETESLLSSSFATVSFGSSSGSSSSSGGGFSNGGSSGGGGSW